MTTRLSTFIIVLLGLSACQPTITPEFILQNLQSIQIAEADVARHYVIPALGQTANSPIQNFALNPVPISQKKSNIVITDTIGLLTEKDNVSVVPSPSGINVVVGLNLQDGEFFCQDNTNGLLTAQRGNINPHLNIRQLTPLDDFPAANHFATTTMTDVIIMKRENDGSYTEVGRFSNVNQRICVYHSQQTLYVASQ